MKVLLGNLRNNDNKAFGYNFSPALQKDKYFQLCLFYSGLTAPYGSFTSFKKKDSLVKLIMLNSLKSPNAVGNCVDKVTQNVEKLGKQIE